MSPIIPLACFADGVSDAIAPRSSSGPRTTRKAFALLRYPSPVLDWVSVTLFNSQTLLTTSVEPDCMSSTLNLGVSLGLLPCVIHTVLGIRSYSKSGMARHHVTHCKHSHPSACRNNHNHYKNPPRHRVQAATTYSHGCIYNSCTMQQSTKHEPTTLTLTLTYSPTPTHVRARAHTHAYARPHPRPHAHTHTRTRVPHTRIPPHPTTTRQHRGGEGYRHPLNIWPLGVWFRP